MTRTVEPVRLVALHGLPTSPRLWEKLRLPARWTLHAPPVPGLGPEGTPSWWTLQHCARQLEDEVAEADVIAGHDLGGVLAAMLARPDQTVVLSGTALGIYWAGIRVTALPGLERFFYRRYAGSRFLSRGCLPQYAAELRQTFPAPSPDFAARMRRIAAEMRPPSGLARKLRANRVALIWGREDPWYPRSVARAVALGSSGSIHWLPAGHFAPFEAPELFSAALMRAHRDGI